MNIFSCSKDSKLWASSSLLFAVLSMPLGAIQVVVLVQPARLLVLLSGVC